MPKFKKNQKSWYKRWWSIVLFVIIGFSVLGLIIQSSNYNHSSSSSNNVEETLAEVDILLANYSSSNSNTIPISTHSRCGNDECEDKESYGSCPQDCKIQEIERIAEEYHKTHTYTLDDFYVCSDMAMDVWNLLRTQGINAKLCAGNVEEDISAYLKTDNYDFFTYFNKMNHAWVLAEGDPFKYVAVETTGGFLVWDEDNSGEKLTEKNLYYTGNCFSSPRQFKSFINARTNMLEVCSEAIDMENYWNSNYVGIIPTAQVYEYKGKMEQKHQECLNVIYEMKGLMSS